MAPLLLAGLLLAACGSSHVSARGSTTTAPPTTATTTATITTTSPFPETTSTSGASPVECTTEQLAGSVGSAGGAAGTIYYQLQLRNTSRASCFVQGYPGVQFLAGGDGRPDGAPARRVTGPAPKVALGPGATAYATLGVADAGNFGTGCLMTSEEGFRVYPPDQTAGLFVAHADEGCGNGADQTLSIQPLQASPAA